MNQNFLFSYVIVIFVYIVVQTTSQMSSIKIGVRKFENNDSRHVLILFYVLGVGYPSCLVDQQYGLWTLATKLYLQFNTGYRRRISFISRKSWLTWYFIKLFTTVKLIRVYEVYFEVGYKCFESLVIIEHFGSSYIPL